MRQDFKSFVVVSQSGCVLPALLILNVLFGWLFLRPLQWLLLELILFALFIIRAVITGKKIFSATSRQDNGVIDVDAEVIADKKRLKKD